MEENLWRSARHLFKLAIATGCLIIAIFLWMQWRSEPYIYKDDTAVPSAQVALVLGASVLGAHTLSPVLEQRANEALVLYQMGKVKKILVTGDNASTTYNEVDPVGKYLLASGVPKEDIFLDHAGFDTYSSLYRARDVFDVSTVIIVSQSFHLSRAIFIARSLGLEAYGVPADRGERYASNSLREIPASIKAALDVLFARIPKYLGPSIPVGGSGISTWPKEDVIL